MKATEDESKRSPTRRRLFGPVDHNQNKVDASLIWTNINPGFPRVDYSPRFRPRPMDRDSFAEAGRGVETEGEVETEGGVQMESSAETNDHDRRQPHDQRRSTGTSSAGTSNSSALNNTRSWNESAAWARSDHRATIGSNLSPSTGSAVSATGCSVDRRRRPDSEHEYTDDCSEEADHNTGVSSSSPPVSLDPSCRSRPATCPWRTLPRVPDPAFSDEGRTRSASLGHISRPSCSRQRSFVCRDNRTDEGSTNLDPTYKTVPVVQLRGADTTSVLCPPGQQDYFFKPIGGGEDSPAPLTASQSPDEGVDDESSGGTHGQQETVASVADNGATTEVVLCEREDVVRGDYCSFISEVVAKEQRTVPQHQQQQPHQSTRRRRKSIDETDDSMEYEKDEEMASHDCGDREEGNGEERSGEDGNGEEGNGEEGNGEGRADRRDQSGRRIKDKLVITPPKAKKRKPQEDGNSDSLY